MFLEAPEYELPANTSPREVEHKPNESPFDTAEHDCNEREYVTRSVVHKREIGEENGEVDKRHDEPAHVIVRVRSREQPPHVKRENDTRVDHEQPACNRLAPEEWANAHNI